MEVQLDKRYPLEVGVAQAWAVLADIRATAGCMPGAAITEQLDDTHYKGTVKTKIGPAVMSFAGDIEVLGIDAAANELQMMAKGADRSGSSAAMKLKAHLEAGETAGTAVLVGQATVTVSGKLAQFGSRLLVPVSDAMLAQFADNFRAAAGALAAPAPAWTGDGTSGDTTVTRMVSHGEAPGGLPATAPSSQQLPQAPQPQPPAPVKELNALGLMWTVFKAWLAGLFRRKA
ncbi:MAG: carbon monoxide dehydrogenase [Leptothrix sp. (in: Bacteria)]|nr:carbon monoxide dehydrogenase [Leptothrix sp. (in: b-proteobacteria)]